MPSPHWAAAQVYPQREHIALYALDLLGYQIYAPRLAERRIVRGRKTDVLLPLFPGYCFVLVVDHWWSAMRAPGIVRLVMAGARPARVADSIIDDLKGRERRGVIELPAPPRLRPGCRVRLVGGLLSGRTGVVQLHRGLNGSERIVVLLAALGRVEVAQSAVEVI